MPSDCALYPGTRAGVLRYCRLWHDTPNPLRADGLTSGKAVLVVWVYAIAGVCGLRVILFAAPRGFCPIAAIASRVFDYRAALHCGIGIAQSLTRRSEFSLHPRCSPGTQGSMTGGCSHDPVTVATAQGRPGCPCWHRPCRSIPACAFAPLTMVSNPGVPGLVR